jgi:hypothetical protein
MALKPKSAVLQIRLDPQLLVRYQVMAEHHNMTTSEFLRQRMLNELKQFDEYMARRHKRMNTE